MNQSTDPLHLSTYTPDNRLATQSVPAFINDGTGQSPAAILTLTPPAGSRFVQLQNAADVYVSVGSGVQVASAIPAPGLGSKVVFGGSGEHVQLDGLAAPIKVTAVSTLAATTVAPIWGK